MNQFIHLQHYDSPCGALVLASFADKLCLCDWSGNPLAERNKRRLVKYMNTSFKTETSSVLKETRSQLDEYFAGYRTSFDIPLHLIGTDFQQRVWKELLNIPYGTTKSYKEIALSIGNTKGVRAVAGAIGANGISILIPCHRVVGSNNSLTGYAGGLEAKRTLIGIEMQIKLGRNDAYTKSIDYK